MSQEAEFEELVGQSLERRSGAPRPYETRGQVAFLFESLAKIDDFLQAYPHIRRRHVGRVLRLAGRTVVKSL